MKFAVITFPGSNCDQDVYYVTQGLFQEATDLLWYNEQKDLSEYNCVILPGGFSYGDYLRAGAIARFSPIMESVIQYSRKGGLVLGICNGFQILLEAGLLPGAMKRNNSLKFVCRYSKLKVSNNQTPFTGSCRKGQVLKIPVAHGEGNYYIDEIGLKELKKHNQIVLKYHNDDENPNGSVANIAGICNREGNVFGMMPHPERCAERLPGNSGADGYYIFQSIIDFVKRGEKVGC